MGFGAEGAAGDPKPHIQKGCLSAEPDVELSGKSEGHPWFYLEPLPQRPRNFCTHLSGFSSGVVPSGMLRIVNVEQKILALESLLEKVRTNAAKPRPARGAAITASQPTTTASRATDDVAGPAVAAAPVRVAPTAVAPGNTKFGDDDWSDTTETFDTPVPLAAPLLQSLAKDAKPPVTKPTPAKPIAATTTPKPIDTAAAKPATPATPAKPVIAPPTIKPVVTAPAVKPAITTPTAKPATPQNSPIPLTNKVTPPVIKTPAIPAAAKPIEANINKTLTGVGDGAVKAPDIRAGAAAAGISLPITGEPPPVEPIVELEKKAVPAKPEADRKPSLPSAIADAEGEEENEPTQLYEPSAASRRAMELAAMNEKQLEDAKKSLGIDKKPDGDKLAIHLPDAKDTSDKIEVNVDAPKIELPWVENTERKIDPEKIGLSKPDDKPGKKGPSRTELDLELVAAQEGALENVEVDVNEQKDAKKPEVAAAKPPVLDDKPQTPPETAVAEKTSIAETKPVVERKPIATSEPVLEQPSKPSKGTSPLVIVVALVLVLAAGAFVAMKQGWIGGASPTPNPTVAPPTNPTPTATQTAAPTATQTAATTNTAPAASASAAPADSAAAPADSAAAAPADSAAAAPADSAAAPPASASAAAEPATPPATAGTPSVDPATLNNNQGLIFVTANKPARVYLTGKLAGDTNTELKVDCGLKFVRLADPAQDLAKPPMWLTAGEPKQIDCRKYTTFSVNVP